MRKKITIVIVIFFAASVAGIFWLWRSASAADSSMDGQFDRLSRLNSFTQNHVQVDIDLERDPSGQTYLAATYKPLDATFHLYSKDLPRNGIDGVGRPTLLELTGGAQSAGNLTDSVTATNMAVDGFDAPFPIYPDGPVTLRLPIKAEPGSSSVDLSLTYMACSLTGGCFPPVIDKRISVQDIALLQ